MATHGVKHIIDEAAKDARHDDELTPIPYKDHRNRNLQVTEPGSFLVTRKVMDKRYGRNGLVSLNIVCWTAAEAGIVADEWAAAVNDNYKGKNTTIPDGVKVVR